MESNLSVVAKKFWHMGRVALFMLRKGLSKCKILAELINTMMKRGKIAGKAIHNLMSHDSHRGGGSSAATSAYATFTPHPDDYEFSCSISPANKPGFHLPFHLNKRKNKGSYTPLMEDKSMAASAEVKALEMLQSEAAALPGLGRSPAMVKQLRITDSSFPLRDDEDSRHVDEAAEQFITNFYKNLRRQSEQLI